MKKYILKYKCLNVMHIILISFKSACLVGASVTLSMMLNKLVSNDFTGFLVWLGVEIGLYVLFLADTYLISVHQTKLIQKMSLCLRDDYITSLTKQSFSAFKTKTVGEHLSILNNDIKIIEEKGFDSFYALVSTIFTTLFSIVALLSYDYRIVVLTIILTVMLTYLPRSFAVKMERAMEQFSKGNETFISSLTDQLTGYDALYYANKKTMLPIKSGEIIKTLISEKIKFVKTSTFIDIIMSLFSILSQILTLLLTGYLIMLKQVPIGTISSVGQIAGNIFNSLTTFNQLQVSIASVEVIFEKFESSTKNTQNSFSDKEIEKIQLLNVGYSFNGKIIFENINGIFEKGKNYAIVGESGSGKSTLINMILGNHKDYVGSVKYNKEELSNIDEAQLLRCISYVGNNTHIYQDSLRNNLTLWDNHIKEEEMISALEHVNLLSLVSRLDDIVNVSMLSEGQKQRIGIARAYLTNRNIIIMDEAMANLDTNNAFLIENQLLKDPTKTYITVSHHLQENLLDQFHEIITL
ncbi:ATP-binding cassette domain-containing protein [Streptococcus phocae subsp. salmonis]|uniref:ATP-binding cassette domain-containing protein n=1 Tax=Streptococcus phocae TaxID=119224 RepID=UPI0005321C2A|nr:ABC transporter ATP-binding protein [Streptococcus phocae]KGR72458.1 ABC transporter ATP-binding protein [Streptococcus phocae subsp. salmonis]